MTPSRPQANHRWTQRNLCDRRGWLLAVSGRLPFEAPNVPALLLKQATEEAPNVTRAAPGLPPALAAAIDRCLVRDPAERFVDGEALAEALAPAPDARPALPPTLRAWLSARNPLLAPYMAWSGVFGTLTTINLAIWLAGQRPNGPADIVLLPRLLRCHSFRFVASTSTRQPAIPRWTHAPDLRAALDIGGASGLRLRHWAATKQRAAPIASTARHGRIGDLARGDLCVGRSGSDP